MKVPRDKMEAWVEALRKASKELNRLSNHYGDYDDFSERVINGVIDEMEEML